MLYLQVLTHQNDSTYKNIYFNVGTGIGGGAWYHCYRKWALIMSLRGPILSCKNDPCAVIMACEWCGSNIGNGTNSTWRCESYAGTLSPQLKDTYGRNPWPVGTFHWSQELMVHWTGLSLDIFGYEINCTFFTWRRVKSRIIFHIEWLFPQSVGAT